MSNTRHGVAQNEGGSAQRVAFKILDTSGTPSIAFVNPPLAFAGDVTVVDSGLGQYTVSIANFKGPQGVAVPLVSCAENCNPTVESVSYSGTTLSFAIKLNCVNSFIDADCFVAVDAF